MDFGVALAVGVAGGGRLTETGLSVGTPYYMSPEHATAEGWTGGLASTASAVLLYEMLGGDPPCLTLADLYRVEGDEHLSRSYYDSAASAVVGRRDAAPPGGPGAEHREAYYTYIWEGALSVAKAGPGDRAAVLQHLQRRLEVQPAMKDRFRVMTSDDWTAHADVMVGEHDAALDELESRLSGPSLSSVAQIRADPLYDPLREDPRFQALLERYGALLTPDAQGAPTALCGTLG